MIVEEEVAPVSFGHNSGFSRCVSSNSEMLGGWDAFVNFLITLYLTSNVESTLTE